MKHELENKLFKNHPKLFCQRHQTPHESSMYWGIDCPDSWYHILDCMCWCIQNYIDLGDRKYIHYPFGRFFAKLFRNPKFMGKWIRKDIPQIEFTQVKEKFGSLRVYTNRCEKVIDEIINMTSILSTTICADCGSMNNVRLDGSAYVIYLCEQCRGENGKSK